MGAQFSQFFPPRPTFTLDDVPSLSGKVIIITGAASGIGLELTRMLYQKGATIYLAGRSESHAQNAIESIQATAFPSNTITGHLHYLPLHLDDLTTIKSTVEAFAALETKLDLLVNNAGVSQPPLGSVSKQGIELQLATNCLGPFLLTQLLLPFLNTSATTSPSAPRVIWTSSQVAELSAPPEGIIMSELQSPPPNAVRNYVTSKLGNWFLSVEFAYRYGGNGIISVAQNPGAASTNLLRNAQLMKILSWPLLHSPALAAHTVLFAACAEELDRPENNGAYVIPWGRIHPGVATGLEKHLKRAEDGGTGRAREFWDWCEERTRDYM
ncbi:short-chain dehydrogenase [Aspergillus homomorphus CBS 101889]|uniref:Short-chain dehydrogenase n=1 Tax=Aspergillus homomorphus (strain CBS 101889) TaxID=1450537 RepID=A0A395IBN2_ASPHC|nr:short-chain dehydrogenase [Aspergillus homomorphus CBS 101889]RAL17431.1 short-chain dehydrogenase [Aspergillus homomorphus CBS 101889]